MSAAKELRHNKVGRSRPSRAKPRLRALSAWDDLSNLQTQQHIHDENYHQDIWCLPFNARIKHMVLHFAKYTGKCILAHENKDASLIIPTVVDTWIITMAVANMLNLRLASSIGLTKRDKANLRDLGKSLLISDFSSWKDPFLLSVHQSGKITGRMAKACESLDHGESFDSRGTFEKSTIDMAKLCLALAAFLDVDLLARVFSRWEEIESKSIF